MLKLIKILLTSLIILLTSFSNIFAQVVINEGFPNPVGPESGGEWVELFNTSSEVQSLNDCTLHLHSTDNNQRVVFGDEAFIDDYEVISWDDSWLNNGGDLVRLICPNFSDSISYGDVNGSTVEAPAEGVSIGRNPNGTGGFYVLASVTMGGPNSAPPTSTPTPTNTPTPTPTPTKSPTPTKVPTPTKTPTPKPTVKPSPTQKPTVIVSPTNNQTEDITQNLVLGERNQLTPTPSEIESTKESGKVPLTAGLFILGGLSFLGAAAYPMIKNRKKGI